MASSSTYGLEGVLASIDLVPESSFVREEAMAILEAPLAIMPPPSYTMSGGTSLKSTARSKAPLGGDNEKKAPSTRPTTNAIRLKRMVPEASELRKQSFVTPLGNSVSRASSSMHTARPSPSYTIVDVRKPNGGYRKALMHKLAKELVRKLTPLGKELAESSSVPLRIKRFIKLHPIKQPMGQYESSDEEDAPPKGPSIASLSSKNAILRDLL
jgi:hypothetical protein